MFSSLFVFLNQLFGYTQPKIETTIVNPYSIRSKVEDVTLHNDGCYISIPRTEQRPKVILQVHGGAWSIPADEVTAHREGIQAVYDKGMAFALENLDDPMGIIVHVLTLLEDDPTFNAGTGSVMTREGHVEVDAGVMDGRTLESGAVTCIRNFPNASQIALAVMRETPHILMGGVGAENFAKEQGFKQVTVEEITTASERAKWEELKDIGFLDDRDYFGCTPTRSRPPKTLLSSSPLSKSKTEQKEEEGSSELVLEVKEPPHDTVGVVLAILDEQEGRYHLYAGTSTGGTRRKRSGRIGDSPILGSGFYANDKTVCVSCTGLGEKFITFNAAFSISEKVRFGMPIQEAVEVVLDEIYYDGQGGTGGIIAIDKDGNCGAVFSSPDISFVGERITHLRPVLDEDESKA
jgi:beta-aspartyl-peptidase (threonine type)